MSEHKVFITILAGGRGERFWPMSRKVTPKQVLKLFSDKTLIEETVFRLRPLTGKDNLYILCNKELKSPLSKVKSLKSAKIIAEPASRNTAGAIALISSLIEKRCADSIVVVLPCDQYIADKNKFVSVLKDGIKAAAASEKIVTIGIKPTHPATGYGYINVGKKTAGVYGDASVFEVKSFSEKPTSKTAEKYFKSRSYLWNAGIFIFKSSVMMSLFKKHSPEIYNDIAKITAAKNFDLSLSRIYPKIKKISIDYCVMEKTKDILCVEGNFDWCDIGSWESFGSVSKKDKNGNVIKTPDFRGVAVEDSIVIAEKGHLIGAVGVSGLVIVQTKDATLICPKEKSQEVRALVERLKKSKKTEKFL